MASFMAISPASWGLERVRKLSTFRSIVKVGQAGINTGHAQLTLRAGNLIN